LDPARARMVLPALSLLVGAKLDDLGDELG
jgi:hypothetical protein